MDAREAERTALKCGRLVLAVLFLFPSIALGQTQALQSQSLPQSDRSKCMFPTSVLIDLRHRLAETKWPDQLPGTTWEYGADIKKVRELADYWQNGLRLARARSQDQPL